MTTLTTSGPWLAVTASEIGAAHVRNGTKCQDASRILVDSGALIACVADGAGSAKFSERGARVAVDTFVATSQRLMRQRPSLTALVLQAFDMSRTAVLETADGDSREYATTLLGLVATDDELAAIQIGDGAIIVDGEVAVDSHTGEYANETQFITQSGVEPNTFSVSRKVDHIAMITDGLEGIALNRYGSERVPHGRFFNPMYEWLNESVESDREAQLREFLGSEQVRSRTSDDVTLLLAMRRGASASPIVASPRTAQTSAQYRTRQTLPSRVAPPPDSVGPLSTPPPLPPGRCGGFNWMIAYVLAGILFLVSVLIFVVSSVLDDEPDNRGDLIALIALYYATGGRDWKNSENWLTSEPLDSWYGVTIVGGRVTELHLFANRLSGQIPLELEYLDELKTLNLKDNSLSGCVPDILRDGRYIGILPFCSEAGASTEPVPSPTATATPEPTQTPAPTKTPEPSATPMSDITQISKPQNAEIRKDS